MKCHYEVLGVSRDADDVEIKTAYRKLALRWHPDKNLDDSEEAKEQFQLVQQAYEVLSDPHERAWYDNHREQILRGKNTDYQENCLDLFQYFTVSCFKGYGDDACGFYHVYADVFEKIAAEDAEFMEDEEEIKCIPKFGNSQSNYEEVVGPFYAYWQSYCTRKNYAWLCPYNINEIKDRRILREIEKDMKKIAQKARKERNEEVRNLVSFIRKRDKRVQANKKLLEERAAANRQKQEQIRIEQLIKRKKEIEEAQKKANSTLDDSYEEQLRQLEQEYDSEDESYSIEDEISDKDDEDYDHDTEGGGECNDKNSSKEEEYDYDSSFFCIACDKVFSNQNAYLNHQSSKKHKLNVQIIKDSFREEKEEFDKQLNGENLTEEENETEEIETEEIEAEKIETEEIKTPSKQKNKKNKKSKKSQVEVNHYEDAGELPDMLGRIEIEKDDWEEDNGKSRRKSKKGTQKKSVTNQSTAPKEITSNETPKKIEKVEIKEAVQTDIAHICVTCKSTFESKNRLFAHLKKTDHGVYIPRKNTASAGTPSEKNKKGKRNK